MAQRFQVRTSTKSGMLLLILVIAFVVALALVGASPAFDAGARALASDEGSDALLAAPSAFDSDVRTQASEEASDFNIDESVLNPSLLGNNFEYTDASGLTWQCREYGSDNKAAVVYGVDYSGSNNLTSLIIPATVHYETAGSDRTVKGIISRAAGVAHSETPEYQDDDCFEAFNQDKVNAIGIPESVEFIGFAAFNSYPSLATVTFVDGSALKGIASGAFANCTALTQFSNTSKVTIPENVNYIGYNAFAGCSSMKEIVLPAGAKVDKRALSEGCTALTTIQNVPAAGLDITGAPLSTISYASGSESIDGLDIDAAAKTSLTKVVLPEGLKKIGGSAFEGCKSLTSCNLPSSLTAIGDSAFSGCAALTGITALPSGVTSVGDYAFYGCKNLHMAVNHPGTSLRYQYAGSGITSISVSSGIKELLTSSFCGCENLASITGGNANFKTSGGILYGPMSNGASYSLQCYPAAKSGGSFTVPASVGGKPVNTLGSFAFDSCKFSEIHIPASIESIPYDTCYYLPLYEAYDSQGLEKRWWAFDHMKAKPTVYYVPGSWAETNLKGSYSPIKAEATTSTSTSTPGTKSNPSNTTSSSANDISTMKASLSFTKIKYSYGKAIKPKVTVGKLVEDRDFTVSYRNNLNVGTAYVDITGIGNYKGSKTLQFTIEKGDIAKLYTGLRLSKEKMAYTGKALKPSVLSATSPARSEYVITYANNKAIGTATATITGKGNYNGSKKLTFQIVPGKVTTLKAKAAKKKVKVSWKALKGGVKYQVSYKAGNGKWVKKKASKAKITLKNLKSGKKYKVKVRAFKKVRGKTYYGAWSATKSVKVK